MSTISDARRTNLKVLYSGKDISKNIEPFIIDFSYSDSAKGQADDLQILLEDSQELWQKDWSPQKGDKIKVEITTSNWEGNGAAQPLSCGEMEVDETTLRGTPDTFNLKAVSVPISSSLRGEKKTKAWEAINLSAIVKDIAKNYQMELDFKCGKDDPFYNRVDQTEKSDLEFLQNLCERHGLSLKVYNKKIVIFDDRDFEAEPPKKTIKKHGSTVLKYNFYSSSRDCYSACKLTYYNAQKKENLTYTFTPQNPPATAQVLSINEQVDSAEEAEKLAKKRLRQKNKNEHKASLTLVGDVSLVAGITLLLEGWGVYDGKYIVDKTRHYYNFSGYRVDLELRKVLDDY